MKKNKNRKPAALFIFSLVGLLLVVFVVPFALPDQKGRVQTLSLPKMDELLFVDDENLSLYPWDRYKEETLLSCQQYFSAEDLQSWSQQIADLLFFFQLELDSSEIAEMESELEYGEQSGILYLHDYPITGLNNEEVLLNCAFSSGLPVAFSISKQEKTEISRSELENLYQSVFLSTEQYYVTNEQTTVPYEADSEYREEQDLNQVMPETFLNWYFFQDLPFPSESESVSQVMIMIPESIMMRESDYRFVSDNRVYTVYESNQSRLVLIYDPAFPQLPFSGCSFQIFM